jgi:hypothetical protein
VINELFYVFPAGKKLKKMYPKIDLNAHNTSTSIRICIIKLLQQYSSPKTQLPTINLATDSPLVIEAFKRFINFLSPR